MELPCGAGDRVAAPAAAQRGERREAARQSGRLRARRGAGDFFAFGAFGAFGGGFASSSSSLSSSQAAECSEEGSSDPELWIMNSSGPGSSFTRHWLLRFLWFRAGSSWGRRGVERCDMSPGGRRGHGRQRTRTRSG